MYILVVFVLILFNSKLLFFVFKVVEDVFFKWRGIIVNGGKIKIYIGGEFLDSKIDKWLEV